MNEPEPELTKAMVYLFAIGVVGILALYYYYIRTSLQQQEAIFENVKNRGVGGSDSSSNSHSPRDEGGVVIFPVTDKPEDDSAA